MEIIKKLIISIVVAVFSNSIFATELEIKSNEVVHDHKSKTITYIGDVKLTTTDSAKITFSANEVIIENGQTPAKGNVKILQSGKNFIVADSAIVSFGDSSVTISMAQAKQYAGNAL